MPQLTVNNINLYYEQHGSGDDLVLIGGLTSDHQVWKSTLRHFSKHFRVLIFDNRGAGKSDAPNYPYTTEMMAQDTLQLMDALSISRAHVVGHSMGGCIAQKMALIAPSKINKCVIACARAKPSALANMILSMREKLQKKGMTTDVLAEYVLPFLFSEHFLKNTVQVNGFIQWTLQNPLPQTAIGYQQQLHAVKTHDVSEQLNHITMPTLIIAGEEDILMPLKKMEAISKSLKNSTFISIPNCAHMPHVEAPQEFVDAVLKFLL
jgi:pimeloyl-ACP methyl ester carboxylesterase